jgi:hypothetical protein
VIQAGRPSLNCACESKHRLCADGREGKIALSVPFFLSHKFKLARFFFENGLSRFFGRCAQVVSF